MENLNRKDIFDNIKRIVIKVGTSTLTYPDMSLNLERIAGLAREISQLRQNEKDIIFVTSGAVAAGMGKLGWKNRPRTIPGQQAAAALGQSHLMHTYEEIFGEYGQLVAQILLTQEDISDRKRYTNASNTLSTLLQCGVIPIINENDTVAVDEIKFGDNDTLSAMVTNLIKADLLLILSDVNGLYDNSGQIIGIVQSITPEIKEMAGGKGSEVSQGGMFTKLRAAEIVTGAGEMMVIANGRKSGIITQVLGGYDEGTLFLPRSDKMSGKKRWIAYSQQCKGTIKVDAGASLALIEHGKSLLPSGIIEVSGNFDFGDAVSCVDSNGREFARGLINYNAEEVNKIKGKKTDQIESVLGYIYYDEVIHRDNLVILENI